MLKAGTEDEGSGYGALPEGAGAGTDDGGCAGGPQSNATLCTPTSQLSCSTWAGSFTVTDVAPPHCVFSMVVPWLEHGAVCLQISPFS